MDELMLRAVDLSLGGGLTSSPIDNKRAVMALRSATTLESHSMIMELVKAKRQQHRTWLTITQRQWQKNRRTITHRSCEILKRQWGNRHSDETVLRVVRESVNTRERYVRCHA